MFDTGTFPYLSLAADFRPSKTCFARFRLAVDPAALIIVFIKLQSFTEIGARKLNHVKIETGSRGDCARKENLTLPQLEMFDVEQYK